MKKKRKISRWVLLAALLIIAFPLVIFAKRYYDARYVLDDSFYTVVPLDYNITPHWDEQGDRVSDYALTCYNADGESRKLDFAVLIDAHSSDLYPPGTFIRVDVSKQLVIGRRAVGEASVPEKARGLIASRYAPSAASSLDEYASERTRQLVAKYVTPSPAVASPAMSCAVDGATLVYTYLFAAGSREEAEDAAKLLDPVYSVQFRTDKQAFPELDAIFLEIKLDDGTPVFSRKYDKRVEFDYEK